MQPRRSEFSIKALHSLNARRWTKKDCSIGRQSTSAGTGGTGTHAPARCLAIITSSKHHGGTAEAHQGTQNAKRPLLRQCGIAKGRSILCPGESLFVSLSIGFHDISG